VLAYAVFPISSLTQARMVDLTAPPMNNEYDPKDQRGNFGISEEGAIVYPNSDA
jgi:hypothetical protein